MREKIFLKKAMALITALVCAFTISGTVIPISTVNVKAASKKILYSSAKKNISLYEDAKTKVNIQWKKKGKLSLKTSDISVAKASITKKGKTRKLTIKAVGEGSCTITVSGKGTKQKVIFRVTVNKRAHFEPDTTATSFTLKKTESVTINFNYDGNGEVYARASNMVADVSVGERNGNSVPVTVTGEEAGNSKIYVTAHGTDSTFVYSISVPHDPIQLYTTSETNITVTEGDVKDVVIGYKGDGTGNVQWENSSSFVAECEWSKKWNNGETTLSIKGKNEGKTTVTITADGTNTKLTFNVTVMEKTYEDKVRITMPSFPLAVSDTLYEHSANITGITYTVTQSYSGGYNVVLKINGTKTYGPASTYMTLNYKLMSGNNMVDSGSIMERIGVGQSFVSEKHFYNVQEGDYTLSFDSVGDHSSLNNAVSISLPSVPVTLSEYGFRNSLIQTFSISDVSYEVNKNYEDTYDITVSLSGTKSYDNNGSGQTRSIRVGWKLYEGGNTVFTDGTAIITGVAMGESFRSKTFIIRDVPAGNYNLSLISTN